jgi:hypothetical protein
MLEKLLGDPVDLIMPVAPVVKETRSGGAPVTDDPFMDDQPVTPPIAGPAQVVARVGKFTLVKG